MKKLAAFLLMCLLLVGVAGADEYSIEMTSLRYAASPHMIASATSEGSLAQYDFFGQYADLFQLIRVSDTGERTIMPTYCADLGRPLEKAGYERKTLEESVFAANAGYIRNILVNGYWPYRDVSRLAEKAGLTEADGTLTEAEALTATQAAIWSYSNGTSKASAKKLQSTYWVVPDYCYMCTNSRSFLNLPYTAVNQKELNIVGTGDGAYGYWYDGEHMDKVAATKNRIFKVYAYLMSLDPIAEAEDVSWTFTGEYVIMSEIWNANNLDGTNTRPDVNSSWWENFWKWWQGIGGNVVPGTGEYYYRIATRFRLDGAETGLDSLTLTAKLVVNDEVQETQTFDMTKAADIAKLQQDAEGYYSVGFSYPLTAEEVGAEQDAKIVLSLSGRQTMSEIPYLYMCSNGRTYSQTLVGVEDKSVALSDSVTLDVEAAKLSLNGQKSRYGQAADVAYSFDLYACDAQGNVAQGSQPLQTVENDGTGKFAFADISYPDKGTYYYKVAENLTGVPADELADYDQSWYLVKAEVTGNGALVVTPTITRHTAAKANPTTVQGLDFDNKPTTTFTVTKVWDVLKADEALIPESVGVTLYENCVPYGSEVTLSADNNWTYTWTGLNADSTWTACETTGSADFTAEVEYTTGGATITNTSKLGSMRVEKIWDLMEYQTQPESVTVQLLKDGTVVKTTTLPNENGGWWCIWTDLDRNAEWTVQEVRPDGMTVEIVTDTAANGRDQTATITNRTEIISASYSLRKQWNLNPYQRMPASVQVGLYRSVGNGEKTLVDTVALSAANDWNHTWDNLDTGYTWSVEELDLPQDMVSSIDYNPLTRAFTLTNATKVSYADYSVKKAWALNEYQNQPASVQVALYYSVGDGAKTQYGETVELSAANNWNHTWEGLDTGYTWSVEEVNLPADMKSTVNYDSATRTFTLTNATEASYADYSVRKVWNLNAYQNQPASVQVALYYSVGDGAKTQYGEAIELSAANGWSHTWEGLDTGYTWSVEEVNLPADMKSTVTYDSTTRAFTLTNATEASYADYSVRKVWNLNAYQNQPASVQVALYYSVGDGDKTQYGENVELSAANDWSHTWQNLDSGYTWSVEEVNLPAGMHCDVAYDSLTRTFTLTNSTIVRLTDYSVTKKWDVRDHDERIQPVYVALYYSVGGGYARQYGAAVRLSSDNSWSHTWRNLDAGYTWSVEEVEVPEDMTARVSVDATGRNFTITNCLDELTDISVRKVWEVRRSRIPEYVDVNLLRDGAVYATVRLSKENGWAHTWEELSAEHVWTVEEVNIPEGMTATVEQTGTDFVITNQMAVDVPDTGDDSLPLLWTALCLLCGAALVMIRRRAKA